MGSQILPRIVALLIAVTALAVPLRAGVVVVDQGGTPGTFPTVAAGLAAAAEGDIVLVTGAGTVNFPEDVEILGMSVSLIADEGVVPRIRSLEIRLVGVGQAVLVRGFEIGMFPLASTGEGLRIIGCDGTVRLEDCGVQGRGGSAGSVSPFMGAFDGWRGASIVECADIVAHRCTFGGGSGGTVFDEDVELTVSDGADGALVYESDAVFTECAFVGGTGGSMLDTLPTTGGRGGTALSIDSSRVILEGGSATGGNGGSADCDVFGCGNGGGGGDGIHQDGAAAELVRRDVLLTGGTGGAAGGFGAFPGANGDPLAIDAGTAIAFPAPARGFTVSSPAREGGIITFTFDGETGDAMLLWIGLKTGQILKPAYQGAWIGTGDFLVAALPAGVVATGGVPLVLAVPVPALPPGVEDVALVAQSATIPAGGGGLLGPASFLTLLDEAF